MDRPGLIKVSYENGPFRYLNNSWKFSADPRGCHVDFFVDFEFRSRLLQSAIGVVFHEAVRRMVHAFLKRAREVYGHPKATIDVVVSVTEEDATSEKGVASAPVGET
jgi:coenzyme Q-binding protein COQ10